MKIKNYSKKLLSMFMALIIVLSAFPITSLASTYITNMNSNADFGVISGSLDKYGHELHYAKYDGKTYIVFCVQYGKTSPDGSTYKYGSDFNKYVNSKGATYDTIADYIAFGYTIPNGDGLPSTKQEWIDACCTQQYVWEKLGVNPTRSSWNSDYMSDSLYKTWKSDTESLMSEYYDKLPSFNGDTKTINLGGSVTLTDSNGVFKYYPTFTKTIDKVTFSHTKGENKLTITVADNCSTHSVQFKSSTEKIYKGLPNGDNYSSEQNNYVYFEFKEGSIQNLMFSNYVDPQTFSINVNVEFGNLKITKTSEDDIVEGITFTVTGNGNTYTMTTDKNGTATLTNIPVGTYTVKENGIIRYVAQATKSVTVTDGNTANVSFNNELKKGNIKILKDSEDNIVTDFTFKVTGSDGSSYSATTNSSGIATITDLPVYDSNNNKITYYIQETNIPIRYEAQEIESVTISAGNTTSVSFYNELKKGDIKIQKNSEDNIVKDFTFKVDGSDGNTHTAITNSSGIATITDLPVYDSSNHKIVYTVQETSVPVRYVTPDNQTVILEPDKTSTLTFNNILKKFRVQVTKSDIEKGKAQGDASLAGAKYGIYKGDQLIDTYYTDDNASFTTKYYICDTDWTIREIESSEGYLVNSKVEKVGADPKLYTVEYNTTANKVAEQVIKGNIAIIKHTDNGDTQIETPEKGAEFQIYLKSAGSFVNADADEKDTIICDEDGFASSKLLPYGVYTVHQTKGWDGREKIKDFDVFINSDGKTYKFLINNANFESYLKVVKLDKETGKQIAYEGAAFEIYDSDGHRVTMQFTYPEVTSIHTFYTNSEGYLITPEKLPYGDFSLVEVQAPYGYVLDSTPIPFTITQENSSTDTGVTVVKVKARDVAQKGVIEITKTGEVFSSVGVLGGGYIDENGTDVEFPTTYSPIYETANLSNAVFQIYAAEDITTLDGTVRAYQGELVDEITTGKDGIAKSKELYLGKYTVIEKTSPDTFVNANEQYDLELTYAGQEVALTSTALSVFNKRQRVTVSLAKIMEQDEIFNLGNNNELLSVKFGVYANENVKAADGTIIPKDALITYGNCDENGKLTFNCDLPIGFKWYAKEMSVDEHYILSDTKYEFTTEYQGQEVQTINVELNNGEPIVNELIYGSIKGLKIDRETEETIEGALFGLFRSDETEFTEDNAILTCETDKDGLFAFENIPYGNWLVKEIQSAENYLPSDDIYHVTVMEDEQVIEIKVVNDRIPELKTTATVDGEKTVCATEVFTLTDTVEYKHLIPGKEYTLKGVLMDKTTGKEFVINGETVTAETIFIPTEPSGTATVGFTFDSKYIKADTDIVVFESLYKDGTELAVHADIEDEGQTVTVKVPTIQTMAAIDGEKEITADGEITITDTVAYTNLTPGKEYKIVGTLMDKSTGKPFEVDGKPVTSEVKFTPTESDGEVTVEFTFDSSVITEDTELVVFETLYRENVEVASHADIDDEGQTVTIKVPVPETPSTPKTSDDRNYGFWIGLGFIAIGGAVAAVILKIKSKKDEDEE